MSTILSPNPTLELVRDGRVVKVFEIPGTDFHIGRRPGLEVCLHSAAVSGDHARIGRRPEGSYEIVDLNSKNTTRVNGMVLTPYEPVALVDGSRIRIVHEEFVFRLHSINVRDVEPKGSTVVSSLADLSSIGLSRRSTRPEAALQAILDVCRALTGGGGLDDVLGRALDGLLTAFPRAERGLILTSTPDGTLPPERFVHRDRDDPNRTPTISRSIAKQVLMEGKALRIEDVTLDQVFKSNLSVASQMRSVLCVPLPGSQSRPVGMAQLDRLTAGKGFTEADLELLAALATPIGMAVENHRMQTNWAMSEAAGQIQRALLPPTRPEVPGYEFWDCYRPAFEVGGDLYDYIRVDLPYVAGEAPSRWAVALGDVAGKGMPAALLMASFCPELRHLARAGVAPEEILARVNRHIYQADIESRFLTLAMVLIGPGPEPLTLVNAGHMAPLVRRADGPIEAVGEEASGMLLGANPDSSYQPVAFTVAPGDVCVLYSDGVTDGLNRAGKQFGLERLHKAIADAPEGAAAVGEAILAAVREHASGRPQFDDITLVCIGRV